MEVQRPEWITQMEGVLDTLNEGVLVTDDCQNIISVNDRLLAMAGLDPEQILGRQPGHFYEGEDRAFLNDQIARGERVGHNRFEFYVPRFLGGRVPVTISARVLEDPDGRQFAVVTFTDITEQKQAEARLKEANQKLEERQREIDIELELAARVQQSLAPQSIRWGRVLVEAFYQPVRSIGGDFGLVAPDGDDQLNLMVCDVSGHGISSALVANRIYSEAASLLEERTEMAEMMRKLNRLVLEQIGVSNMFFTLALARLNANGHLTFAGAGHPPAIRVTAAGDCQRLDSRSLPLGAMENAVLPEPVETLQLECGDRLVLYSDGLTDVFDSGGEMLGIEGLEDIIRRSASQPLGEMKNTILRQVATWGGGPSTDDVSLLIVGCL